jgi:glycerophosphoryl diester phosphodiesterase
VWSTKRGFLVHVTALFPGLRTGTLPLVIGHRGAPGYLPEHTRASYRLAIALGADAIEPDLVITRDGVLVARHENELSCSTDVACHHEFADRRTTRTVAGREITGWFVEDFTLAEVKTLRAVERWPATRASSARSDRVHEIVTFDELLLMVKEESHNVGRDIGLYVELKWSSYFASIGLPLEPAVLASLRDHDLARRDAPVHLLSFETTNLRWLRDRCDVRLAQLVAGAGAPADCVASGDPTTYDDLVTSSGLRVVSRYADVLVLAKDLLVPDERWSSAPDPYRTVDEAHLAGLKVLAYTLRNENRFLAPPFRTSNEPDAFGDILGETRAILDLGIDGLFTDHPDTSVLAREIWSSARAR